MKRAFLAGLLAAAMASSTGCCQMWHQLIYCPFGPGTMPDPTHCGPECGCQPFGPAATCGIDSCGPACGPSCRSCDPCDDCDSCGPCDTCGPCGSHGYHDGPLTFVLGLFNPTTWGCGPGCGEMYYGDFHGDPPDLCDPCDRMGCWTGGGCSTGSCSAGTYSTGGCPTCGSTAMRAQPRVISEDEEVVGPAKQVPTKAAPGGNVPTKVMPTVPTMPAKPQPVSPEAARPLRGSTRR